MNFCKKAVCLLLAAVMSLPLSLKVNAAPSVSAKAAILMQANSGEILFANNENERLPMASTTKIMTSLLLLENVQSGCTIDVTQEMIAVEGSSMGLRVGDTVSRDVLLYGMLMSSGNDAANVSAYMVSGGTEEFVSLMNKRAKQLGADNTSFETPSGLDGENHYSTAHDMAKIAAYAMQNEQFADAVCQKYAVVSYGDPVTEHTLNNHNRLLSMYEGCCGIKTGFTKKSGRCLVSCAKRNGIELICVTLNDPDDWKDHMALFDYGFSLYDSFTPNESDIPETADVVGGTIDFVNIDHTAIDKICVRKDRIDDIEKRIILPRFLYAPVQKGEAVGRIEYLLDGDVIYEITLTAGFSIDERIIKRPQSLAQKIGAFFKGLFGIKQDTD